jgi:hypothetical protein
MVERDRPERALRIGLVNRVVAEDALEDETPAIARRMASGPRMALTADHKEAVLAFAEKRPPRFHTR